MKDEEKKVNEAEEVKNEEEGVELTDEELVQVTGGTEQPVSQSSHENSVTFQPFDTEVG